MAFVLAAALPATACFAVFSALFSITGANAFITNVLAFITVTVLALVILKQLPFDVTRDLPLWVWATPLVLAIPVALWTFSAAKQGAPGGVP